MYSMIALRQLQNTIFFNAEVGLKLKVLLSPGSQTTYNSICIHL